MFKAKIIEDSIADHGKRLTTFEITYPRIVHAEFMTHRALSRNSASSRAIPQKTMRERVLSDPFIPEWWGMNERGMQARSEIGPSEKETAEEIWLSARDVMVKYSDQLAELGVHKQIVNRVLEPWMFITVIVTATEWNNFFFLRDHEDAQPEIQKIAKMMKAEYLARRDEAIYRKYGDWHLPYVTQEERRQYDLRTLVKVSTGRCARVSYLTHDGKRDLMKDVDLHNRLLKITPNLADPDATLATRWPSITGPAFELTEPQHLSPFEHVATPLAMAHSKSGNFEGWKQYRKVVEQKPPSVYEEGEDNGES